MPLKIYEIIVNLAIHISATNQIDHHSPIVYIIFIQLCLLGCLIVILVLGKKFLRILSNISPQNHTLNQGRIQGFQHSRQNKIQRPSAIRVCYVANKKITRRLCSPQNLTPRATAPLSGTGLDLNYKKSRDDCLFIGFYLLIFIILVEMHLCGAAI